MRMALIPVSCLVVLVLALMALPLGKAEAQGAGIVCGRGFLDGVRVMDNPAQHPNVVTSMILLYSVDGRGFAPISLPQSAFHSDGDRRWGAIYLDGGKSEGIIAAQHNTLVTALGSRLPVRITSVGGDCRSWSKDVSIELCTTQASCNR